MSGSSSGTWNFGSNSSAILQPPPSFGNPLECFNASMQLTLSGRCSVTISGILRPAPILSQGEESGSLLPKVFQDVGKFMAGIEQPKDDVGMAGGVGCGNLGWHHRIPPSVEHQGRLSELGLIFVISGVLHNLVAQRDFPVVAVMENGNRAILLPARQFLG